MTKLSCQNLTVEIERQKILDDISVSITENGFTALIGANGSGKTTLLRALCNLRNPTSGSIHLDGLDLGKYHRLELAKKISWLPQTNEIPFAFSSLETVVLGRYPIHLGRPQKDDFELSMNALKAVGMENFAHRSLPSLSGGERQRVLLARVMACDCDVILLDEPCANLDLSSALTLLKNLQAIAQNGKAICISIHDVGLAKRFCSHTVALKHGKLIAAGETATMMTENLVKDVLGVNVRTVATGAGESTFIYA